MIEDRDGKCKWRKVVVLGGLAPSQSKGGIMNDSREERFESGKHLVRDMVSNAHQRGAHGNAEHWRSVGERYVSWEICTHVQFWLFTFPSAEVGGNAAYCALFKRSLEVAPIEDWTDADSQNGAQMGCISLRNAQTAASSAAVRFSYLMPRNHLQEMTRAGFESATYGLKERPSFIPRVRPSTPKFVPVLLLYSSGVRARFAEFSGVPCTSRDKWGATRVHQTPLR